MAVSKLYLKKSVSVVPGPELLVLCLSWLKDRYGEEKSNFQKLYVSVPGRELKPEPSEAGADDELDLEDTTTTSSSLEIPMFFLEVSRGL